MSEKFEVVRLEFPTDVLTSDEAAQAIGLTSSSLRAYRSMGIGPRYVKIGHRVRYHICDLQEWLDEHKSEVLA